MSKDYNGVIKVSDSPRIKAKDKELSQDSAYKIIKKEEL